MPTQPMCYTFFKKLKRVVPTVPVVLALFCGVLPQSRGDVVVEPPGAIVVGKSIAAWSTNWWRWAAALAPPRDPFTDTNGQFANAHQSGPVFFLAGSPGGSHSRNFHVPAYTYVLAPLLVGEDSQLELGFGNTAAQVRQAAQQQANQIDSLHAILDGVPISQTVLFTHRETSPDFNFYAVYNNQVGINASGNSGIAVADGYFLMLAPLEPGTHTLNYGGGASTLGALADETDVVSVDVTTNLIPVEPPGAIVAGKSIAAWSTNWWRWAAALAPPGDPFTDTTGQFANVNQSGPVFFLAGSPGGSRSRHFRVPGATYVLVPLLVGEYSQLELGFSNTAAQVRQAAQQQANQIDGLYAILDGVPISQTVLFTHRETSPDFNFYAVPNNQVGIHAYGNSGIAVADGYFLMIDPLAPGTHTLIYGGGASTLGALADETDVITVPPSPIPLNFQRVNNTLVLTWTNAAFTLQRANDINGPYTTLGAISNGVSLLTSPYTNTLTFGPEFFRLQAINMP